MRKCWCCGRSETEVKKAAVDILDRELAEKSRPLEATIEERLTYAIDIEAKWKEFNAAIPKELLVTFNLGAVSILKEIQNLKIPGLQDFLGFINGLVGGGMPDLKMGDLESMVNAKVEEIKNVVEPRSQLEKLREEQRRRREAVIADPDMVGEWSPVPRGSGDSLEGLKVGFCKVCRGLAREAAQR